MLPPIENKQNYNTYKNNEPNKADLSSTDEDIFIKVQSAATKNLTLVNAPSIVNPKELLTKIEHSEKVILPEFDLSNINNININLWLYQ